MASALAWVNVYLARSKATAHTFFTVHLPAWGASSSASLGIAARAVRNARQLRLFAIELGGVVLTAYGISWWSVPSAVVIGGLVLVAAAEVRPHVASTMPDLPIPETLVRAQAEQAARLINNARYGIAEVDIDAMDKLSRHECEQIITVARSLAQQVTQ